MLRLLRVRGSISQCQGPSASINTKCSKMVVSGKMWVWKPEKCCPKLFDTSLLENNCLLSKALLSSDHAPWGGFIAMGWFSENVMDSVLAKCPNQPLERRLSKWWKQDCNVCVKQETFEFEKENWGSHYRYFPCWSSGGFYRILE